MPSGTSLLDACVNYVLQIHTCHVELHSKTLVSSITGHDAANG
jgi:hypothetical protein